MKRRLIAGTINRYPPEEGWSNTHLDASARRLHPLEGGAKAPPEIVASISEIPVPAQTFDEVRCWQTLEHLYLEDARRALREFHRILVPGGILDLEVPDLVAVARLIATGEYTAEEATQTLYGEQREGIEDCGLMVHRYGYTAASLRAELEAAGFTGLYLMRDTGICLRFTAVRPCD